MSENGLFALVLIVLLLGITSCGIASTLTKERAREFDRLHPAPTACGGFLEPKCAK